MASICAGMRKCGMPDPLAEYLERTIDRELPHLQSLTDDQASVSLRGAWTRKEELGHLIDSATNNHARFVTVALEDGYRGRSYDADGWVRVHGYAHMPWATLVDLWYSLNSLIAEVVRNIPEDRLPATCEIGDSGELTLAFLIEDYIVHMQHHVDQMLGREIVTQYPQIQTAMQQR